MNTEMNLNTDLIKNERERRAWSQSHLAEAAGISLRTLQRVEATGKASKETTLAIASALSSSVELLTSSPKQKKSRSALRFAWPSALAASFAVGSFFLAQQAFAQQLMLDVKLGLANQQHDSRLITDAGQPAEIRVDGKIRVVITPTMTESGDVFLQTEIYSFKNGHFVLSGKPGLIIKENTEAKVISDTEDNESYSLSITPHLINTP